MLARIPHDQLAVQWDVAVEIGVLEGGRNHAGVRPFEAILERLARCVNRAPADVRVGLHLCYGDYQHQHFIQPKSLELQVRLVNQLVARATRPVDWFSLTVPQDQRDETYFAPLADLHPDADPALPRTSALPPGRPTSPAPPAPNSSCSTPTSPAPQPAPATGDLHRMRDGPSGPRRRARPARPAP